jgi:probable rRNA maturation factor
MARGSVTIALISDRRIRELNRRFRNIDETTDVLSFSMEGESAAELFKGSKPDLGSSVSRSPKKSLNNAAPKILGDIAIAVGVARRQARQADHSLGTEVRILALHGLLHLLGYDHDQGEGKMRRLERRLSREAGLQNSVLDREKKQ